MDQTTKYDKLYEDMDSGYVLLVVQAAEMEMSLEHHAFLNSDQPNDSATGNCASPNSGQPNELAADHCAFLKSGQPNESTALENPNTSSKVEPMPINETSSNAANDDADGFEEMLFLASLEAEKKYEAALALLMCAQEFRINKKM